MSRNTIQQDIICTTVKSMRNHPSPDDIYEKVRENYPSIGRATVYRVLNKLVQKGEIGRVVLPNTADRYDFRTDEHIHIRCKHCNKVFDADPEDSREVLAWMKKLAAQDRQKPDGFEITNVNLSFEGICRDCLAKLENEQTI